MSSTIESRLRAIARRAGRAGVFCFLLVIAAGCSEAETLRPGLDLVVPPPRPSAPGTVSPTVSPKLGRAQQFLDVAKLEMQLGAYEAAISAFEAVLQLDPDNQDAKRGLEQARQAAAQATPVPRPTATPTPVILLTAPLVIPPGPAGPPSPGPVQTPTPAPTGCQGDEKMAFEPATAALGDPLTLSVTSARNHANVRVAAPTPAEFLGSAQIATGYLWQWRITATSKGDFTYYFYVDYNTLCALGKLTVTGRWQPLSSGLPSPEDFRITAIVVSPNFPFDKTLFVAFNGKGVYKSSNADADSPTFRAINQGLDSLGITTLAVSPDYGRDATLFVGTKEGFVYTSTDGGEGWLISPAPGGLGKEVTALVFSPNFATDGTVFAGVDGGVFQSPNKGGAWFPMNEGLTDRAVQALAISADYANDGIVFSGGKFSGAYRLGTATPVAGQPTSGTPTATPAPGQLLPPASVKWSSINAGLEDLWVRTLAISPYYANDRTVFAGSAYGGLFKHDGIQWKKVNGGLADRWVWVHSIALSPRFPREPTVYAGTRSGVYRTLDGGETWVLMRSGLPDISAVPDPNRGVRAFAISPDFGNDRTIFAGVWLNNIYRARD